MSELSVDVYDLITLETHRQDDKWGPQEHHDEKWLRIFIEEVGEIANAMNEHDEDNLDVELIQTLAVGVQWYRNRQRAQSQFRKPAASAANGTARFPEHVAFVSGERRLARWRRLASDFSHLHF